MRVFFKSPIPQFLRVGVPMTWEATGRLVLDSIRNSIQNVQKKKLLLAASSTWGKRPQMLRCISNKLKLEDFEGHADTPKTPGKAKIKTDRRKYYETLSAARIALAFPGLGYDCFRTWEILTLGGVIALERGVGLDRSVGSETFTCECTAHSNISRVYVWAMNTISLEASMRAYVHMHTKVYVCLHTYPVSYASPKPPNSYGVYRRFC